VCEPKIIYGSFYNTMYGGEKPQKKKEGCDSMDMNVKAETLIRRVADGEIWNSDIDELSSLPGVYVEVGEEVLTVPGLCAEYERIVIVVVEGDDYNGVYWFVDRFKDAPEGDPAERRRLIPIRDDREIQDIIESYKNYV